MLQSIHRFSSLVCSGKESRSDLRSPFSVSVRTFGAGDRGSSLHTPCATACATACRSLAHFGNSFPKLLMSAVCYANCGKPMYACVCAQVTPASPQTEVTLDD
jgi:hypothetical protein